PSPSRAGRAREAGRCRGGPSSPPGGSMKKILIVAFVALCATAIRVSGQGETPPAWAYPQAQSQQRPPDDGKVHHLEGRTAGFTETQVNDPFAPPDWYPNEHPPMPEVVAHGRKPDLRA